MDDAIKEKRLRQKDTVIAAGSLQKITEAIQALAAKPEDAKASQRAAEDVLRELHCYVQSQLKARFLQTTVNIEIENFERLKNEIRIRSEAASDEIVALERELAQEKDIRAKKEEYEALCHKLNRLPSKRKTLADIAELEEQLQRLRQEEIRLNELQSSREKHLVALLQSIDDLKASYVVEEEQPQVPAGDDDNAQTRRDLDGADEETSSKRRRGQSEDVETPVAAAMEAAMEGEGDGDPTTTAELQ